MDRLARGLELNEAAYLEKAAKMAKLPGWTHYSVQYRKYSEACARLLRQIKDIECEIPDPSEERKPPLVARLVSKFFAR